LSSRRRLCLVEGDIFFPEKAAKPETPKNKGASDAGRLISGKGNPSSQPLGPRGCFQEGQRGASESAPGSFRKIAAIDESQGSSQITGKQASQGCPATKEGGKNFFSSYFSAIRMYCSWIRLRSNSANSASIRCCSFGSKYSMLEQNNSISSLCI
jgi:hypothetical protein